MSTSDLVRVDAEGRTWVRWVQVAGSDYREEWFPESDNLNNNDNPKEQG